MSSYQEAVAALDGRGFTRMEFDLGKIEDLLDVLGSRSGRTRRST